MTDVVAPCRASSGVGKAVADDQQSHSRQNSYWQTTFLARLAETSNVASAARQARVSSSLAYSTRRCDRAFAKAWREALLEGYEHLEMETLCRLRTGTGKDDQKFDIGNALRILTIHRATAAEEREHQDTRTENEVIASIDAKLERFRVRKDNVTRMLVDEGIGSPQLPGADE